MTELALIKQIDALLSLNSNGGCTPRIPGLAVELLQRAKAELEASAYIERLWAAKNDELNALKANGASS